MTTERREIAWNPPIELIPALLSGLAAGPGSVTRHSLPIEGLSPAPDNPDRLPDGGWWYRPPGRRKMEWDTNRRSEEVRNVGSHEIVSRREYAIPRDEWLATLCPLGRVGDWVWIREGWRRDWVSVGGLSGPGVAYRIDGFRRAIVHPDCNWQVPDGPTGWRPPAHMPRWASRLTLEIVSLRVGLAAGPGTGGDHDTNSLAWHVEFATVHPIAPESTDGREA